jgi:hypothetical protein
VAASVREGIERAAEAIDSGAVRAKLDGMIEASKKPASPPAGASEAAAASRAEARTRGGGV